MFRLIVWMMDISIIKLLLIFRYWWMQFKPVRSRTVHRFTKQLPVSVQSRLSRRNLQPRFTCSLDAATSAYFGKRVSSVAIALQTKKPNIASWKVVNRHSDVIVVVESLTNWTFSAVFYTFQPYFFIFVLPPAVQRTKTESCSLQSEGQIER